MIVTRLIPDGKYKIHIELDGEKGFSLYKKEIRRLQIEEEMELSEKIVEQIYEKILYPRAKEKALSLLQYRNRTKLEMKQKLEQNGYPKEIINRVDDFLQRYGFLDDEQYTKSYIELYAKKKSKLQMQQDLRRKGISKELFSEIWEEQPEESEEESLKKLMEKRFRNGNMPTKETFQKHYAFFARRGYPSSMIVKLLKEYQLSDEYEDI